MKTKSFNKKLVLRKKTIADLSSNLMKNVLAGDEQTQIVTNCLPCTFTCVVCSATCAKTCAATCATNCSCNVTECETISPCIC